MHSAATDKATNNKTNPSNTSAILPKPGSTSPAAAAIRAALTLTVLSALLPIAARPAHAQTETVLYNFCSVEPPYNCLDGANPSSALTADGAGNFYGTTDFGGEFGFGTVFELSPNGGGGWNESVLHNFCALGPPCTDGANPQGPVVFDSVGNIYGTTSYGGNANCGNSPGCGVAFELSPAGAAWTETAVHDFCSQYYGGSCHDGDYPGGVVTEAAGNLYGTEPEGVFELSPSDEKWTFKLISSNVVNLPSGLVMDAAGNIFAVGQTLSGWAVSEVSPNGGGWNTTSIYTFTGIPRTVIWSPLILDGDGNLYGTETAWYHNEKKPLNFRGTVFKLSPGESGWTKTTLFTFTPDNGATEGNGPSGGLTLDAAGNIYGTTLQGGTYGLGTVFELVPGAKGKYEEQVLWSFNGTDGNSPNGGLIFDSSGNLYGTTSFGGQYGYGTVFEITP